MNINWIILLCLTFQIFSYVDLKDLANCACVCRSWKVITQSSFVWCRVCTFSVIIYWIGWYVYFDSVKFKNHETLNIRGYYCMILCIIHCYSSVFIVLLKIIIGWNSSLDMAFSNKENLLTTVITCELLLFVWF